jgi:phenylpropionate dioxygenase-like ring-hydroxylating dioxygenase large terminal subunit
MEQLPFVRNAWYAAAWSEEITRDLEERWICGIPIVFYRTEAGTAVALEGTCPHRQYPLALGRLKRDNLECGYHGITFGSSGACVHVPGEQRAPAAMKVRAFPLHERGGLIWLYAGDPSKADPANIIDQWLGTPGWASVHGTKILEGRAQLLIENLMDLSHEAFLHPETIGNASVAETPIITDTTADGHVRATRLMKDIPPPPLFAKFGVGERIDRTQIAEFCAPSVVLTRARAAATQPGFATLNFVVMHCVTPETATRTRYNWAVARDYALDDQSVSDAWQSGSSWIFDQDVAALNAQEARLQRLAPDHIELSIPGDAAALAARRMVKQLAALERREPVPAG